MILNAELSGRETLAAGKTRAIGGFVYDPAENDGVAFEDLPEEGLELRVQYDGIRPAYHMNKNHWSNPAKLIRVIPEKEK